MRVSPVVKGGHYHASGGSNAGNACTASAYNVLLARDFLIGRCCCKQQVPQLRYIAGHSARCAILRSRCAALSCGVGNQPTEILICIGQNYDATIADGFPGNSRSLQKTIASAPGPAALRSQNCLVLVALCDYTEHVER